MKQLKDKIAESCYTPRRDLKKCSFRGRQSEYSLLRRCDTMNFDPLNLKICYIGGGSRNWAWVFMKDLTFEHSIGGTICLYDRNYDASLANEVIGNRLMAAHNPGQWKFVAESSLERALDGADFVLISILPGDFTEMAVDVHEPEQYGIYQSVGDTTGPGGIIRALRTLPMFQEFAKSIQQWAPDAWVLNYTNPMTLCTQMLYAEFPQIKAFGCCHEVFGTQKLLIKVMEHYGWVEKGSVHREEITTNVLGINHFTWIDRASWKNKDLFPLYRQFAQEYALTGFDEGGDDNWINNYFTSCDRVKLDLFNRYGLIAAAGDRHLAEFCPPSWYLANPQVVAEWKYSLTPVSFRIKQREELLKKSKAYQEGHESMPISPSGEEGIRLMKAIIGLENIVTNVNLPNKGQIPDLPVGAVVETNAFFSRDMVLPMVTNGFSPELRTLIIHHLTQYEGILKAVQERDLETAFRVFLNDYQIQKLTVPQARKLFTNLYKYGRKDVAFFRGRLGRIPFIGLLYFKKARK